MLNWPEFCCQALLYGQCRKSGILNKTKKTAIPANQGYPESMHRKNYVHQSGKAFISAHTVGSFSLSGIPKSRLNKAGTLCEERMTAGQSDITHRTHGRIVFGFVVVWLCVLFSRTTTADGIVLDDFTTISSGTTTTTPSGGASGRIFGGTSVNLMPDESVAWTDTSSGGMLWNQRTTTMQKGNSGSPASILTIDNGLLDLSHPSGDVDLSLTLSYSQSPNSFKDLSASAFFIIEVDNKDLSAAGTLAPTLRLYDSTTSASLQFSSSLNIGLNVLSLQPLLSQLNMHSIRQADVIFTVPTDVDFTLDSMYFAPVPEPGVFGLIGLLFGVAIIWSRRRRLAAPPGHKQSA